MTPHTGATFPAPWNHGLRRVAVYVGPLPVRFFLWR
jgi:hypothetical protein